MRLRPSLSFIFFTLCCLLAACAGEAETVDERLYGRWEITEGLRNGRPAESLSELFFEFEETGILRTNLSGATIEGEYKLDDDRILQREAEIETEYKVVSLTDSTLVLTTRLRNFNFEFQMVKSPSSQ